MSELMSVAVKPRTWKASQGKSNNADCSILTSSKISGLICCRTAFWMIWVSSSLPMMGSVLAGDICGRIALAVVVGCFQLPVA